MKSQTGLRRRLIIFLLPVVLLTWLSASVMAVLMTRHEVDELYDTQMADFSRQVMRMSQPNAAAPASAAIQDRLLLGNGNNGTVNVSELGFAVWGSRHQRIFSDEQGKNLPFEPGLEGFANRTVPGSGQEWRVYYRSAPDGATRVAIVQRLDERWFVTSKIVLTQALPWLLALPFMLLLILWALGKALSPLGHLTRSLVDRDGDDMTPLPLQVPTEVLPLVETLNALFVRISRSMARERRFTADAAHELRSPLAALKVQAQVLKMIRDEGAQQHALSQLMCGIERAEHLVTQMLVLSRLDAQDSPPQCEPVDWERAVQSALHEVAWLAEQRDSFLSLHVEDGQTLPVNGDETLLGLLLRNLLDNALRYGPEGVEITLRLTPTEVTVLDNGPGIDPDWLSQVGERDFFVLPAKL